MVVAVHTGVVMVGWSVAMGQLMRVWMARLLLVPMLVAVLLVGPDWALADATGAELFANHCAGCHIQGGNIIRRNKTLRLAALQRNGIDGPEAIAAIATAGLGQMSGYGDVLGGQGAQAVADYVWQQAQVDWPKAA
jgi:cytochrome c6